ncbi:Lrp/AsnC family transcriptional regulator [Hydrogenoanaerobacterium sp.]|uniref:Lrp/AsnC family transcriptional regulator n=1 Tax=Hydrogenoanaerobacterium sp. TaxID=2953763 RepID=UPI00289B9A5E|nr:Lrp/AsnC family transcriptional regulator [Hydrogenoanaerobacterium sp.]
MYQMDKTDYEILEILKADGRSSYSDIAEQVHLSRVAVRERIIGMKKSGIIRGFTVVIDAKAYQKFASIFLDVEVEPNKLHSVARQLVEMKEIAIVSQHTGLTGLHVHAYIDSIGNLSQYLEENIYSIDGVKSIQSHILIRQYKTNSYLARYSDGD